MAREGGSVAIDAPAPPVEAPEVASTESSKVAEVMSTAFIEHGVLTSGAATSALCLQIVRVR